jgi:hypothetical protein
MSPEEEIARMIRDAVRKELSSVLIGCIGRIDQFYDARMRADVQPLLMIGMGDSPDEPAKRLTDIPVQFLFAGGFAIKPTYRIGDLVWVSFATHPIEHSVTGQYDTTNGRLFDRQAASVAHGILPNGRAFPALSQPGMVIANETGTFLFHIQDTEAKIETPQLKIVTGATTYTFQPALSPEIDVGGHGHMHSDTPNPSPVRTIGGAVA